MKAENIYHKIRAIAEDYHSYSDQMVAIAKWIESEFEYKPDKIITGAVVNSIKHTPGPWKLDDSGEAVISERGEYIAVWATDNGSEITPGNLQLISAAPDLLKACITAKAMYEAQGINENSRIGGLQYRELLAAIKKATE